MSHAKMSRFFIFSSQADIDKNIKVKSIPLFVSLSSSVILPVAQKLIYYRRDRYVSIFWSWTRSESPQLQCPTSTTRRVASPLGVLVEAI